MTDTNMTEFNKVFDIAIIGGGIMGCGVALRVNAGGMRAVVLDQGDLGQGASGVNAGTLSLQIKRIKLMPYALRGHDRWAQMGDTVGFHRTGGYTLAFTEREAELLEQRMTMKRDAGAPIEFISPELLARAEPGLSGKVIAASYCCEDGYANSSLTGQYYRKALSEANIPYFEHAPATAIEQSSNGFTIRTPQRSFHARRLLLACGAWLQPAARMLGAELPVRARVNTVSVLERSQPLISSVIGHATGLLTMKQKPNGTILVGGGWQGRGTPQDGRGEVDPGSLQANLKLARYALPALSRLRVLRSWTGFEANVPDFYPLAGALPGVANAYVLGCVRGGYTIGPYISELMGDFILYRQPELPLFDPARNFNEE